MDDFEITFLGTGTSVGIPVIGCQCPVCTSSDPRNNRTRSSLHVRSPGAGWIVDTGPDLRQQCLREQITRLDAALITHAHTDHIMGFDDLRRFTSGRDASIDIYATAHSMEVLENAFHFAFDGENRYPGYLKPEPHVIEGTFRLGDIDVSALPVRHGKVDTIGYLFEHAKRPLRVAYVPDCKQVLPESEERMQALDLLIIDALRYSPHATHMNFEEALSFVERVAPRRTLFTHIACEVDHEKGEKDLPDHVRIAYDGLKVNL